MTEPRSTPTPPAASSPVVGFIGCGKMGGALAKAFVASGALAPADLVLFDRADACVDEVASATGGRRVGSARALCEAADVVFLSVKPQDFPVVLADVGAIEVRTWVSIAAGVRLESLRQAVGPTAGVVRTMPNRPALVRAGVTGVMGDPYTDEARVAEVERLLQGAGATVRLVRESDFDGLTAVSGSGPAFVYLMVEALIAGGVAEGLDPDAARALALATTEGAARLLAELGTDPADERAAVSSKGGTTLAGLAVLAERGFADAVGAAVAAAAARSRELGA